MRKWGSWTVEPDGDDLNGLGETINQYERCPDYGVEDLGGVGDLGRGEDQPWDASSTKDAIYIHSIRVEKELDNLTLGVGKAEPDTPTAVVNLEAGVIDRWEGFED
jgi:hypothetical protein